MRLEILCGHIFGQLFSEKLFREQLAFHEDIDYSGYFMSYEE